MMWLAVTFGGAVALSAPESSAPAPAALSAWDLAASLLPPESLESAAPLHPVSARAAASSRPVTAWTGRTERRERMRRTPRGRDGPECSFDA